MGLEGHREHHALSSAKRLRTTGGPDEYEAFQRTRGAQSIDGLPALEA
jgi:hypothetical protein